MAEGREIRQQELARLMLQKARQDLETARTLGDSEKVADEIVGFHVQQTIEKALKAVLIRKGIRYDFTHDLSVLVQQVEAAGTNVPASLEALEGLTPFAVEFRYTLYEEAGFDRQAGARLADELVEWARGVVEAPVESKGAGDLTVGPPQ